MRMTKTFILEVCLEEWAQEENIISDINTALLKEIDALKWVEISEELEND